MSEYKDGIATNYIEAAMAAEMYRTIIAGEFREKSLKNFNLQALLASKPNKASQNSHSAEWKSLLSVMSQKRADLNIKKLLEDILILDRAEQVRTLYWMRLALSKTFSKVKRNRLSVDEDERQIDDEIKQRRDAYSLLGDIEARIENVAKAELEIGREKLQKIFDAFGDDEVGEDEITEFIARVKKFYEAANKAQVNVKEYHLTE